MDEIRTFVTVAGSHYHVRNSGDRLEANPIGSAGWYTLAFFEPGWEPCRGILLALLGKPSDAALMAELRRTEEFARRDRVELSVLRAEVERLRSEAAALWESDHHGIDAIRHDTEDGSEPSEGQKFCHSNPYAEPK